MGAADTAIDRLSRAVDELITSARAAATSLYQTPGEGEWSAMQNLAHVAEFVPFWAVRARDFAIGRLGEQPFGRTPEEWDQRAAAVTEHANASLESMIDQVKEGLATAVAALRDIPEDGWIRTGVLEPDAPRQSVAELVELRVLGHVESHVRQAAEAAATNASRPEAGSRSAATE
jgi:DinB superfamily